MIIPFATSNNNRIQSRQRYKKQHARGALGKLLLKVYFPQRDRSLMYPLPLLLPPLPFFPAVLLLLILRKRSTGFHGIVGTREQLEISNANAKEVESRQLSLRSYGGLTYTAEAGYGCKRDR